VPAANQQTFTQEQLDQILAPIALYPDALLSQMLMASTYPLEVVEAARWVQQHQDLSATALQRALAAEPWDPSVKSLCVFDTVLERMSRGTAWTQELGEAFIADQQRVMDSIQNLRRRAQAAGTLVSDAHQVVNVENDDIIVAPQNPQIVNVPTYNPAVVYGNWWWPDDPPYYPAYWAPPGGSAFADDFYWGTGIAVGLGLWGLFDWHHHRVDINLSRYNRSYGQHLADAHWRFDPAHREGVGFRSAGAEARFGAHDRAAAQAREQFRDHEPAFGAGDRAFGGRLAGGEAPRSGFREGGMDMAPGERGAGAYAGGAEFRGGGFAHLGGGEMEPGGFGMNRGGGEMEHGGFGSERGGGEMEHGGFGSERGGAEMEHGGFGMEHGGGGMEHGGGGGHGGVGGGHR
jgi:hypothetical protein